MLPQDIATIILEKCDIDTRIKLGYIRRLQVPPKLQADLTRTFSMREDKEGHCCVNLGRRIAVTQETTLSLYSIVRMFSTFCTPRNVMFEERVDHIDDRDQEDIVIRISVTHCDDYLAYWVCV